MSLVVTNVQHAAESSHWYTKDGIPAYEVKAKNGNMRPTTLRDAKKFGYIPSVTTVIRAAASPGLENWKLEQMMLAALTLPKIEGESEQDFIARIRTDSREHAKQAAERGTAIHTAVEGFYRGSGMPDYPDHIRGVENALNAHFGNQDWIAEKSFASYHGFGGKVDLCCAAAVIDIKSKEFGPDNLPEAYDEHLMQLAAYKVGLELTEARLANVFVSVTKPGLVHVVEWSREDFLRGWKMFSGLLSYWYAKTGLPKE